MRGTERINETVDRFPLALESYQQVLKSFIDNVPLVNGTVDVVYIFKKLAVLKLF